MAQKRLSTVQVISKAGVGFTVWPVQKGGRHPEWEGIGGLTIISGAAQLSIDLTPEQMRELAALLVAQSWETEAR